MRKGTKLSLLVCKQALSLKFGQMKTNQMPFWWKGKPDTRGENLGAKWTEDSTAMGMHVAESAHALLPQRQLYSRLVCIYACSTSREPQSYYT